MIGSDFRERKHDWIGIIIHHTGVAGRKEISESLWRKLYKNITNYLAKKDSVYVSAHYHIGRYGESTEIINPRKYVAYHAGKSSFWHPLKRKWINGCNDYFIGIELLGDGNIHDYSNYQYQELAKICNRLLKEYPTINPQCIIGHEVVSPSRKDDPGIKFDWRYFYFLLKFK